MRSENNDAEDWDWLLKLLPDETLRVIAVRKLEGDTNDEIAKRLGCSPAMVEGRLVLVGKYCERVLPA
jgi:DNA-directed RNA polymerase specialized sigma24 family protein